jgi:hypothetical protein
MGKSQFVKLTATSFTRGVAAAVAMGGALAVLTGCVAGASSELEPSVTPTPAPSVDASMGEFSAAFACGEFSALLGLEYTTRWNFEQGATSAEAYGQFLERQAFQLSQTYSSDPDLRDAVAEVRDYFATAARSPEGWAYDPTSQGWRDARTAMSTECDEAGTPLVLKAESGMGG